MENSDLAELIRKDRQWLPQAFLGFAGAAVVLIVLVVLLPHPKPTITTPVASAPQPARDAYDSVKLEGKAAIVYDLSTKQVLYQKNAETQLPLASLTKLLTVYAAANTLSPSTPITISDTAIAQDGDSGLKAGETFAFNDIARFALVASSNDAAEAIAEAAEAKHAENAESLLGGAAAALSLSQTYALNGTGLDESTNEAGAYGSAHDVALLAAGLLENNPRIASATTDSSISIKSLEGTVHTLPNTNQDVVHMPGVLISKTGYTDLAGGNLAIVFDASIGHPIAVVVLGSSRDGRFTDVEQLINATLAHFAHLSDSPSV